MTGNVRIRVNRLHAAGLGWCRGLDKGSGTKDSETGRPSNRRWDLCPAHALAERDRHLERNAASIARRARRAELAKMPPTMRLAEARTMANKAAKRRREAAKAAVAYRGGVEPIG
jgi:hypothetical protein